MRFGQKARASATLKRIHDEKFAERNRYPGPYSTGKGWEPFDHPPIDVIVIGQRTLRNGTSVWGGEDGTEFFVKDTVHAYLVVKDMHTKPFHVLPEHLEDLEQLSGTQEG